MDVGIVLGCRDDAVGADDVTVLVILVVMIQDAAWHLDSAYPLACPG